MKDYLKRNPQIRHDTGGAFMSKEKSLSELDEIVELSYLYDFYGALLKESNRVVFEDYVLSNLSLSEIAKERDITSPTCKVFFFTGGKYSVFDWRCQAFSSFFSVLLEKALESAIVRSLRRGDVTSRFSSTQQVVVLMDASKEDGVMVANLSVIF